MAREVPECHLINPPSAQRCDCGYDFHTKRRERSYLTPAQARRAALASGGALGALLTLYLLYRALAMLVRLFPQ